MRLPEDERINMAAAFLPQHNDEERPAVRLGDVLVFTYFSDGVLCITADTEDCSPDLSVSIRVNVNGGTVWEGDAS